MPYNLAIESEKESKQRKMENNTAPGAKKCLVYCRVSDQDQLKGLSLDVQKDNCTKWAKDNKYKLVETYIDEAKSGTKTAGRDGLEDTLIHCQKEHIDAILVIDTDRFARNEEDHFAIKAILKKLGTKVIAINQPMINDSAEGILFETLIIGVNAFYSRLTGRKVKKSLEKKWNDGWWPGWAPLGYKNINIGTEEHPIRIVQQDPEVAPIIKWAFEHYVKGGCSIIKLINKLNEKGIKTRNGKPIAHSTMQQILTNSFYYGLMKWNNMEKMGNHEPIITKKLFDTCQLMLAKRRNFVTRERKYDFLLRGVVTCAQCGQRYTAEWHFIKSQNRDKIAYYHCAKLQRCQSKYVETEELEKMVAERLKGIKFSKAFTNAVTKQVRRYLKNNDKVVDKARRACLNKRTALIAKRNVLEDSLLSETVDRDTYKRKSSELRAAIENIDTELTNLESNRNFDFDVLEEILALTRNIPKTYKEAPDFLKKKYLNFFFDQIQVNDKKIENTVFSPLITELIEQQKVILRSNWLPR